MPKKTGPTKAELKLRIDVIRKMNQMPIAVAWTLEDVERLRMSKDWVPAAQYGQNIAMLPHELGMIVGQARVLGQVMSLSTSPVGNG